MSQSDSQSPLDFENTLTRSAGCPQLVTPICEWILSPEIAKLLQIIQEKYGEPDSTLPADEEELYCVCVNVQGNGAMVQCDNAERGKCLARWFHLDCIGLKVAPKDHEVWYCLRCRTRRIGGAPRWNPKLSSSTGLLLTAEVAQSIRKTFKQSTPPSQKSTPLPESKANEPRENPTEHELPHRTVPPAADLGSVMLQPNTNLFSNLVDQYLHKPLSRPGADDPLDSIDNDVGGGTSSEETEILGEQEEAGRRPRMAYEHRPPRRREHPESQSTARSNKRKHGVRSNLHPYEDSEIAHPSYKTPIRTLRAMKMRVVEDSDSDESHDSNADDVDRVSKLYSTTESSLDDHKDD